MHWCGSKRIAVLVSIFVLFSGGVALGQTAAVGIFTDAQATSCNIQDDDPYGVINAYVVLGVSGPAVSVSSVQFSAPVSNCMTGITWIADDVRPGFTGTGNSQTGIRIALNGCYDIGTPLHVLTMVLMASGTAQTCCLWPVLPDPHHPSGRVAFKDCSGQTFLGEGYFSRVNGTPSCNCDFGPSTPTPPDGATDISHNGTRLAWDAGVLSTGYLFDVYFGDSTDPPLLRQNVVWPDTVSTGPLQYATTYYWRVVGKGSAGDFEGPLWTLSTEEFVWAPVPADSTGDHGLTTQLGWNIPPPGFGPVFDIYFGTDTDPPLVDSFLVSPAYDPDTLECGTQYFWRIVSHDTTDIESPLWTFWTQTCPPTNPSPPDSSVDQPTDIVLGWDHHSARPGVVFDVYFGTSPEPPLADSALVATTYDPGPLEFGQTYYWYVVAREPGGTPVWSEWWMFSTIGLDYEPANPYPPDGSFNQPTRLSLRWDAVPDSLVEPELVGPDLAAGGFTYDLYFGAGGGPGDSLYSPPLLAANLDTNTYDPGPLLFSHYYTWRVVAKSPGGTEFPGDTWGFMTASSYAHTIRVPVAITNYCGPFGSSVVTIDIRIDGTAAPIDAGMLDLTYDPDLLTLFDFEPGDLTAGWQQFDYADLGTAIRIGGYNLDPIPIGSSGTYATLTFVSNCCGVDMTQSVALCPTNLTDDLRTLIPICGAYQCVFVTRDGDVNADSTVTPGDALCAFRGYLSFPVAPPGDCGTLGWEVRADVDCSNQVTPADALCIFHHALDGSCEFCNIPGLPTPVAAQAAQATAKISVGIPRNEGDELVLPLKVSLVEALDAFGFEVGYPAGDLEYLATDPGAPTAGFDAIDGLLIDEGRVRLGGYSATPIAATSPTDVVNLRFRKLSTTPSGTITIEKFVDDVATAETVKWSFPPTNNDRRNHEIVVMPNYPNPFNPVTEIRYEIPSHLGGVRVTLAIYNVEGRLIRKLVDEPQDAGAHGVQWDSRNDRGEPVSSGIYFYVLRVGEQTFKKKMVLLK